MSQLTTDPGAFLQWLKESIPLAAAMQIEALQFDGQQLEMRAPLAANVNDKGTGFGGSIAALATLAGWSLTTLYLRRQGLDCEVVIAESQQRYLTPVRGDFVARVALPEAGVLAHFQARMEARGRGALSLQPVVLCDHEQAFTMQGHYVARRR